MANRILKPYQVSVNTKGVLVGNIELPSAAEEKGLDSVYDSDADSSQNNLDRYIEQHDDSLDIEDLIEIGDNDDVVIVAEESVAIATPPQEATAEPLQHSVDANDSANNGQDAPPPSADAATNIDASAESDSDADPVVAVADDGAAAPTTDDEAMATNRQLQEALHKLTETEGRLVSLQREREQERAADLQQQERQRKEEQQRAEEERRQIVNAAQQESEQIVATAHTEAEQIQREAHDAGHKEGFNKGYEQVEPVVERLKEVTGKIVQKRQEILTSIEGQMADLVLLIARKVVKILTKENRQIVVENVRRALELVRKRGEVTIRINPADLHLSAASLKKITDAIEHDGMINFIEDGSIEVGGCLIETEFGEIDARIHSQILEIENKILT